jgi:CheY-like chemotaxis protein
MFKGPTTGGRIAVLVVDDDAFVRMDTAEILQQAGFDVEQASTSDEALSRLNGGSSRLDALVTDVQMPGAMNGYGLARHVHALFPQAAIVIMSGVAKPSPGDMPENATFLAKPVIPDHLLRALAEALPRPV